jgi:hypothetical protein
MKGRRLILFATFVVLAFALYWLWQIYLKKGTAVPGTSHFRTHYDSEHGMAVTTGIFEFAGGEKVYLDCWSPHTLMRDHFFKFVIYRPSRSGKETKDTLTMKAGAHTFVFDGQYGIVAPDQDQRTTFWPDYDMTREQLQDIVSAHQMEFDVGKESPLTLSDDQLADIRAFLAYTDKLPEFPRPPEMQTNSP